MPPSAAVCAPAPVASLPACTTTAPVCHRAVSRRLPRSERDADAGSFDDCKERRFFVRDSNREPEATVGVSAKQAHWVSLVCKLASFFDGTFSARAATRRRATFLTLDCLILFWRHSSSRSMILGYHG